MAENPLLPHRKLRELYLLMERCRAAERQARARTSALREAFLAATSIHLLPGDVLSAGADDHVALALAPAPNSRKGWALADIAPAGMSRFALAAAVAAGLKLAGSDSVVLCYTRAGSQEPGWAASLDWAHRHKFPLIVACTDASARSRRTTPLSFNAASVSLFSRRIKLPIVDVDGEDAVGVYRVMQECLFRARIGGGPAVLWASLSSPDATLSTAQQPLGRLEAYLKIRNISLPR